MSAPIVHELRQGEAGSGVQVARPGGEGLAFPNDDVRIALTGGNKQLILGLDSRKAYREPRSHLIISRGDRVNPAVLTKEP